MSATLQSCNLGNDCATMAHLESERFSIFRIEKRTVEDRKTHGEDFAAKEQRRGVRFPIFQIEKRAVKPGKRKEAADRLAAKKLLRVFISLARLGAKTLLRVFISLARLGAKTLLRVFISFARRDENALNRKTNKKQPNQANQARRPKRYSQVLPGYHFACKKSLVDRKHTKSRKSMVFMLRPFG